MPQRCNRSRVKPQQPIFLREAGPCSIMSLHIVREISLTYSPPTLVCWGFPLVDATVASLYLWVREQALVPVLSSEYSGCRGNLLWLSKQKTQLWEEFGEAMENDFQLAPLRFWQTIRRLRWET